MNDSETFYGCIFICMFEKGFFYDAILNFSFLIFMNAVFLLIGNVTGECSVWWCWHIFIIFAKPQCHCFANHVVWPYMWHLKDYRIVTVSLWLEMHRTAMQRDESITYSLCGCYSALTLECMSSHRWIHKQISINKTHKTLFYSTEIWI